MNCQKCNAGNKESNRFCYLCGQELIVTENKDKQSDKQKLMKNPNASQIRNTKAASSSNSFLKSTAVIHKIFRIILAILACFGIFIIYALIGGLLGWKHGGGAIPALIVLSCMGFTWRAITRTKKEK